MSIFSTIASKIFGHSSAKASETATPEQAQPASPTAGFGAQDTVTTTTYNATVVPPAGQQPQQGAAPQQAVDVEAVLTDMAAAAPQTLNWRVSIVDLMKLLGLDSSFAHRKELAGELGYTGDTNDSATMNIWLHKQVMRKLAENGGKVPEDLKA